MMTPEQFEDCLDLYGSNFARWPEGEAADAKALLEISGSARLMLEDALTLDDALGDFTVEAPSAAFEARLLDLAPKPAPKLAQKAGLFGRFNLRSLTMASAGLACAAFGFVVGLQSIQIIQTNTEAEAFMTASITSISEDIWLGDEG